MGNMILIPTSFRDPRFVLTFWHTENKFNCCCFTFFLLDSFLLSSVHFTQQITVWNQFKFSIRLPFYVLFIFFLFNSIGMNRSIRLEQQPFLLRGDVINKIQCVNPFQSKFNMFKRYEGNTKKLSEHKAFLNPKIHWKLFFI